MKTHLTKEEIQMPNKHEKRCSKLLDIKEIQIKYKTRCHFILSIIAVINKRNDNKCQQVWGEGTLIYYSAILERPFGIFISRNETLFSNKNEQTTGR